MQIYETLKEDAIIFAQKLQSKPVYAIEDAIPVAGSSATVYRKLKVLESLGLAKVDRGSFILKRNVITQPIHILQKLLPSLVALSRARRFGRNYNEADIRFALDKIQEKLVTLDYRAYELTKFQTPSNLYLYVDSVEQVANLLKQNGFREGQNGRVILLPKLGDFSNEIERVYLDCIANGGRSTMDAIAIELLYDDKLNIRGMFSVQQIKKVQEDLPEAMTINA